MTKDEIEQKILDLREKYKTATGSSREVIKIRGLMLKKALEKMEGKRTTLFE